MNGIFLEGSARAIILFHAYTGSTADVRLLGTRLNQVGYTVYMPLFSGHGTKDLRCVLAYSPKQWQSEAYQAVMVMKEKGYQQIAVFGLSMGGMFALDILTQSIPEIIGGGSFNSPIPLTDSTLVQQAFVRLANRFYQESMGDKQVYDKEIEQSSVKQLSAIETLTEDIAEQLSYIHVPVYIAQSGEDELIDVEIGEKMMRLMPFTTVDYHYFPKATHVITIGAYKKEFNESVLTFVNQLDWSLT
ncbi:MULTISPECIES: carboxylesterase [unclassified Granulicatella]|uniref:alpha/beta hydrolase n=1 Tax=unclassified Granulicatella TaxID=2630493 RepID=UPI001073950A|nr:MULTISPECIES: alpha/beta hydrolase [unclassified Granulicatella]MBF0780033.1 alpha/beta hydrolase [Granulicatella sp. 19428wC4_WM01]TFU95882.1 carboxylesterase [Granulicatella sp. WM01]